MLYCCYLLAKLCLTLQDPMDAAYQASLSLTISQSLPKFMSIELVMPSNHLGHLVDGILLWQPGLTDTDREGFVIKSATVHRVTKSQT